jgi:hypothetical protein
VAFQRIFFAAEQCNTVVPGTFEYPVNPRLECLTASHLVVADMPMPAPRPRPRPGVRRPGRVAAAGAQPDTTGTRISRSRAASVGRVRATWATAVAGRQGAGTRRRAHCVAVTLVLVAGARAGGLEVGGHAFAVQTVVASACCRR